MSSGGGSSCSHGGCTHGTLLWCLVCAGLELLPVKSSSWCCERERWDSSAHVKNQG